jgi:hypothetical protein
MKPGIGHNRPPASAHRQQLERAAERIRQEMKALAATAESAVSKRWQEIRQRGPSRYWMPSAVDGNRKRSAEKADIDASLRFQAARRRAAQNAFLQRKLTRIERQLAELDRTA